MRSYKLLQKPLSNQTAPPSDVWRLNLSKNLSGSHSKRLQRNIITKKNKKKLVDFFFRDNGKRKIKNKPRIHIPIGSFCHV